MYTLYCSILCYIILREASWCSAAAGALYDVVYYAVVLYNLT